jgi:hypothetical protein
MDVLNTVTIFLLLVIGCVTCISIKYKTCGMFIYLFKLNDFLYKTDKDIHNRVHCVIFSNRSVSLFTNILTIKNCRKCKIKI